MLAVTMGDAAGIGPEILLKAFSKNRLPKNIICFGDYEILSYCNQMLEYRVDIKRIHRLDEWEDSALNLFDAGLLQQEDLEIGKVSVKTGAAALAYVQTATWMAMTGHVDAVVTLPMNKEATRLTHPDFTGHTGYIASLCGTKNYTMMLESDQLIVSHVSTHVPLADAIRRVKADTIFQVIRLTHTALGILRPQQRIAVAGLNPHAGEKGAFGSEEIKEIRPAVEKACCKGWNVTGPMPPDTVFYQALMGHFDAVVCMYHDQGHIPMKVLDFDGGVNVTLGLPIVRTSVDHGTAFDIAYKGLASENSLVRACKLAEMLSIRK